MRYAVSKDFLDDKNNVVPIHYQVEKVVFTNPDFCNEMMKEGLSAMQLRKAIAADHDDEYLEMSSYL